MQCQSAENALWAPVRKGLFSIAAVLSSPTSVGVFISKMVSSFKKSRSHAFSFPKTTKDAHSASVDESKTRAVYDLQSATHL